MYGSNTQVQSFGQKCWWLSTVIFLLLSAWFYIVSKVRYYVNGSCWQHELRDTKMQLFTTVDMMKKLSNARSGEILHHYKQFDGRMCCDRGPFCGKMLASNQALVDFLVVKVWRWSWQWLQTSQVGAGTCNSSVEQEATKANTGSTYCSSLCWYHCNFSSFYLLAYYLLLCCWKATQTFNLSKVTLLNVQSIKQLNWIT